MMVVDLSTLADQLRKEGFTARNLGQVGITIWEGSQGVFLSTEQLKQLPPEFKPRDFHRMLEQRRSGV